jgi:quercetin dioxygenase-like cupin family protein
MTNLYTLKPDIAAEIAVQKESIVSKTVYADDRVKVVLMALDSGQELTDHAASMPAVIHLLRGEARITLGEDPHDLKEGAWMHMSTGLRHAVAAKTPTVLLLLLLKEAAAH